MRMPAVVSRGGEAKVGVKTLVLTVRRPYWPLVFIKSLGKKRTGNGLSRFMPVSYTHLDVYKRQGLIHTDFERGFIRAEVIKYDDFITYGTEHAVKEAGKMVVEGKEYIVQDGDVIYFRFNV